MTPPKIENAPGIRWVKIKHGYQAVWRARSDLVKRGYAFKSARIWSSTPEVAEPDAIALMFIAERCQSYQDDMLTWASGDIPILGAYTGTWKSLSDCYKTDPDSPYLKKEYATRQHYDALLRRINIECGSELISDMDARRLIRLHERVIGKDGAKVSMGHAVIGMMRTITTFGATLLKCPACRLIRSDLRDMRIKNGKPREVHLNADQVIAIRQAAHEMSGPYRHSIALAQALQFEIGSGVRQKDIIGEWLPISEPGISDIVSGNEKWLKGIRGEEIDQNFILRHVTSKRKKLLVADLKFAPMVMEEFRLMAGLGPDDHIERGHIPAKGPLIINETTGKPWLAGNFRKAWRDVATKAGVPAAIRNMDSRAGGVSESFASGANPDDIRKGATHSNLSMTQRYSRDEEAAVARVMQSRAAHRNKDGTK